MTDLDLPIRPGTPEDWPAVSDLMVRSFHGTPDAEAEALEGRFFEPDRSLVVYDGDELVGHAMAFTRELTVPGAVLPAAHVTYVFVAPTHRRRGLLNRLMRRQLREVRDAGRETFAVLWASEGRIYPRYGYGQAAPRLMMEIDSREAQLRTDWQRLAAPAGRLRTGEPAALRKEMTALFERLRPERPGWSSRDERHWDGLLADLERDRDGATPLRAVVHVGADGPTGYALWRTRRGWDVSGPRAEVIAREVVAADPGAYAALWAFLFGIDLSRTVSVPFAAVDEPLRHLVAEAGRLGGRVGDSLWVRVLDVAGALAARRYATPVDVVLAVDDPLLPENSGHWRVVAEDTGDGAAARCERTEAPADLECGIAELGAVYLGGVSFAELAGAGRVRELRPGTLTPASLAFGWHRAPVSIEVF